MRHSVARLVAACAFGMVLAGGAAPAHAQKIDPDGWTPEKLRAALPQYFYPSGGAHSGPADLPDVFGPGSVLRVGNIQMKVTNWGHLGIFFTNLSTDPGGQWPGSSSVEYLSTIRLAVGAVNHGATSPDEVRRVSYNLEWRPQTLEPEDKIYRAYDGIVNGTRFVNDDNDYDSTNPYACDNPPCPKIDEDFLDGRDNDNDGRVDEDFGAVGQQEYSFVMWDNTIQAVNTVFNEKHVPLGLECRTTAWAYSIIGFQDFNVCQYQIYNRSGHLLDSLYVGWLVDMDAGPVDISNYFLDDFDVPTFPQGEYTIVVGGEPGQLPDPLRRQQPHSTIEVQVPKDSALCPRQKIRVNGFSICDDNGDNGKTPGVPSFLLIDETTDPTGETGPTRVGFRAYRSFTAGTPYGQGGNPIVDQQRYEFLSSTENIDPETGFIIAAPGDQKGDYVAWASTGPWLNVPDGGSVTVTIAFAVQNGNYRDLQQWPTDYARYVADRQSNNPTFTAMDLFDKYPGLYNAFTAQVAFEGVNEHRDGYRLTDFHGRETSRQVPPGAPWQNLADCRDIELGRTRQVKDTEPTWFDFDCDYCTGAWDFSRGAGDPKAGGLFHKTWNAEAPPPNPTVNVSAAYNYTDNPNRKYVPSGDNQITVAWDNLSQTTPDPKSQWLDFRGYRVWKVSDWTRPVGSAGPAESDWTLIGEFRIFDYYNGYTHLDRNYTVDDQGHKDCPKILIPNYKDPKTGVIGPATVPICLDDGDLWDRQSGIVLKPDTSLGCTKDLHGNCVVDTVCILGRAPCSTPSNQRTAVHYPIGRYSYVDHEVKNGFQYFYSVTAFDSSDQNGRTTQLGGRRSAVEAEGVVPQASTSTGKVWVVPNPYRGYSNIQSRPSAWDLTPNATDPTGTHIDFMGLPRNKWTIKIYTVSGDLVQVIHSDEAVNESVRPPIQDPSGTTHSGYNRQQDNPNDGQARWNLISRNGQDVVSGIYMFTVESSESTQRGRFVIIR